MCDKGNPDPGIAENLRRVRENIRAACDKAGRSPEEVTLIAVSKQKPFTDIPEACAAGVTCFGENYVQELIPKIEMAAGKKETDRIRWHMIGHLQKNKVKSLIGKVSLIHSVDSTALAEKIEKEAAQKQQTVRILLEVNIAREESKWGFDPDSVLQSAREISALPHVRILGLMTSAPITTEPERNRPYFRRLNALARALAAEKLIPASDPEYRVPVLSMGMSGDYEVAVEEGATMVRIGTAIFGKRKMTNGGI